MGKRVSAIMKTKRKGNKGFTIIELLTAIGIMAVLSISVVLFMSTSSQTYSRLSVESQLQSEAQMVANMITELAIDSYDAEDSSVDDFGYKSEQGKILILDSNVDGAKKQYIVGLKESEKSLYLAERTYDVSSGSWGAVSEALLGNYITDFVVDTSRVEKENMLMFTLSYEKSDRTYDGNYQVLMRNRAYADEEEDTAEEEISASLTIRVSPQIVYVDIVNEDVPSYYIGSIAPANKRTVTSGGIPFTSQVFATPTTSDLSVNWELKNADKDIFSMSTTSGATSDLEWNTSKKAFRESAIDAFMLVITKSMAIDDDSVEANPKTAQILLRRIKSLNLYALSGATQWSSQYTDQYGGTASSQAQGYVYAGSNGKYVPLNLNAAISASNIAYGGGLTWELYMQDSAGNWSVCDNSAFASIQMKETPTGTANVVTMGSAAKNGQLYKVVATSMFDDSYSAEYIFGVAPSTTMDGDGFNSRGFYTNMSSYLSGYQTQGDKSPISNLLYLTVSSIDGSSNIGNWEDKIKIIQDSSGNWRLFVDYDAFSYSGPQKKDFYGGDILIHLVTAYYGEDGKFYICGKDSWKYKDEIKAKLGLTDSDIYQVNDIDIKYKLNPVVVSKIAPVNDVIVLDKGDDKTINVKTAFYNIVSPRKGTYYFGVYIDDMLNNLVQPGKSDINQYFNVAMTSSYGDTNKFVDTASIMLTAKSLTAQKKYLTDPVTLRLAANDYYLISTQSPYTASYTDYKVLISNVEGANCYIPGPKSTYSGLAWPSAADGGTATTVSGLSTNGSSVSAKVYKSGKKYYCQYGGKTYTYNSTYNFWAK